jgi:hypothetical protein
MPVVKDIELPGGWVERSGGPNADLTRSGRPGRRHLQDNDPFFCWAFSVSYKRAKDEDEAAAKFDPVYAFFMVAKGFGFLVDDVADNTADANQGSGVVKLLNGVPRLHKRYTFETLTYDHPITRPKDDVAVSAGTLDYGTGIVSDLDIPEDADEDTVLATWDGGFLRPMLLIDAGLDDNRTPDGLIKMTARLEEIFEFD